VEQGIPEDDPRNPAVIADLVGDMVGDCVGSSADIFESIAAEIIGAMILSGSLAREARLTYPSAYVFFPVMVHAFDIAISSVGILSLGDGDARTGGGAFGLGGRLSAAAAAGEADPLRAMTRGYRICLALAAVVFALLTRGMLAEPSAPGAWLNFYGCGLVGMATSYVFLMTTQYYTDYQYAPVRSIAAASVTGHGTNIIAGVAVGMQSTAAPVLMVGFAVIASYALGARAGLAGGGHNAGLFGTAVATMGMLSSAGYVLAMNNYGPIADNAGGIAEMSGQPQAVRDATDRLDAAGNVTKAMTKGYSIGSAALACFLLFGALMDELSAFAGVEFRRIDIAVPEVLIGGLFGTMMVFYFVGLAVAAVGRAAGHVVEEVRRQLREKPGIMTYADKPNYYACVKIVTAASLAEMRLPGLLAVGMPVTVGLVFRALGEATGRPLLGAEVLVSFLMFGTVAGILMALFLDNVGGAWDNAKKYVEMGNHGGKGSDAHKAAITGDTVGDPFKDTAGPSLHVVIKLLSTCILVLGPLFVSRGSAPAH
jgi:inorganic pyrophosphatase